MNLRSEMHKSSISIEKLKAIQLPNRYKPLGWVLVFIGFCTLLSNGIIDLSELFKIIAKYVILLGLFMVSISREPIEDERIRSIRLQSYSVAFLLAILYAFLIPTFVYLVNTFRDADPKFVDVGDFMILWVLLSMQIFYFTIKKKLQS